MPDTTEQSTTLAEHGGLCLRVLRYEPMECHPIHRHDTANITLVLSGALEESSSGGITSTGVCSVVVKPPELSHADQFGPAATTTLQLRLDRDLARAHASFLGYRWLRGGAACRQMLALLAAARREAPLTREALQMGFIDLLAAINHGHSPARDHVRNRDLRALAEAIDADSAAGLCVRTAAESMRVHPVSLARAFRRCHGCSITEYVRRARTLRACRLLEREECSLVGVAAEAGFADQAHFTRAFRTELGLPPGRYRQLIRQRT